LSGWIPYVEGVIEAVKALKPADRMEVHVALRQCLEAVGASVLGWTSYLSRPEILNMLTHDDLSALFERVRRVTVEFLEADLAATRLVESKGSQLPEPAEVRVV